MDMDFLKKFQWLNRAECRISEKSLIINAHPRSDFFISPAGDKKSSDAALFFTETEDEFILKAKVTHSFKSVFDAAALMVYSDETCWAKLCFELTDFGSHSVVAVVTNGFSDDANGVKIPGNSVWLQITRKDNLIAFHYSEDGTNLEKVRFFRLPVNKKVKTGFVAQSPLGGGGEFMFEDILFKTGGIADVKKGR